MENIDNRQLELFSQSGSGSKTSPVSGGKFFLNSIRAYEKSVLVLIGLVVTGIASFSLGVEKGKELSVRSNVSVLDVAQKIQEPFRNKQAIKKVEQEFLPAQVMPVKKELIRDLPSTPGVYTIQLASYKTKASAQKEAEGLKKKGFSAQVLSKGKYSVLCVGNFTNKETALPILAKLQKSYGGCYIRRL
jgi:hypothetical protein